MDLKWFFLILLNWIATTTTTKWTSKQDEILNKDFLFPDQEQTLRKEVFKKENLRTKKNRGLLVRLNNKNICFSFKSLHRELWRNSTAMGYFTFQE